MSLVQQKYEGTLTLMGVVGKCRMDQYMGIGIKGPSCEPIINIMDLTESHL